MTKQPGSKFNEKKNVMLHFDSFSFKTGVPQAQALNSDISDITGQQYPHQDKAGAQEPASNLNRVTQQEYILNGQRWHLT